MRSAWIVAGVVLLGLALVLSLSTLRQTRTYSYRGEFALEVPRDWMLDPPSHPPLDVLRGKLPSGRVAQLSVQSIPMASPPGGYPDQAREIRVSGPITAELWAEGGRKWSIEHGWSRPGLEWVILGRVQAQDLYFTAFFHLQSEPPEDDRALLERCVRSIHPASK